MKMRVREKRRVVLMCSRFKFNHSTNGKRTLVHIKTSPERLEAKLALPKGDISDTVVSLWKKT